MAGMRVVVVACDDDGNVDVDDLEAKVDEHAADLAALMVTYPSTHGVFEERITDLCDLVHAPRRAGVRRRRQPQRAGRASPGPAGSAATSATSTCTRRSASPTAAAVPASVRWRCASTWRRSCPTTRSCPTPAPPPVPARSPAAPYGSASILPISWAYIALDGPRRAAPGHRAGDPQRQLRGRPPRCRLPGALHGRPRPGGPRVHPRPAPDHRRPPASPSTTSPSGSSTSASTPRR